MQKQPNVLGFGEYYACAAEQYHVRLRDSCNVEYYLGNNIEVNPDFYHLSDEVAEEHALLLHGSVPAADVGFYNYNTEITIPWTQVLRNLTGDVLGPYLSPGNTLTVKYVYDWAIIPGISCRLSWLSQGE